MRNRDISSFILLDNRYFRSFKWIQVTGRLQEEEMSHGGPTWQSLLFQVLTEPVRSMLYHVNNRSEGMHLLFLS
jgi:hypothetical protein